LLQIPEGLPFDRKRWGLLVGELLMICASDIPALDTEPDTLCCLLEPDLYRNRATSRSAPIQQAHFGSRDIVFGGGYYRPDRAGWNDVDDVARLTRYLESVDPQRWSAADLAGHRDLADDQERAEELDYARQRFAALLALYQRAFQEKWVLVSEDIS
jgi:hypothetical protein